MQPSDAALAGLRRRTPPIACPGCGNPVFSYVEVDGRYLRRRCAGPRGCGHVFDSGPKEAQAVRDAWAAAHGITRAAPEQRR